MGFRIFTSHPLAFLLLVAAMTGTAAATEILHVEPGSVRQVAIKKPKPLAFRVWNRGDCSVGIVTRDSFRNETANSVLRPGEARDFVTPSAEVQYATLVARSEGTEGALLEIGEIMPAEDVRMPAGSGGFPCTGFRRTIYLSQDGASVPEVRYRVTNSSSSDCTIQVMSFPPEGAAPQIETVDIGRSIEIVGLYREIQISGGGGSPGDTYVAVYRKMF